MKGQHFIFRVITENVRSIRNTRYYAAMFSAGFLILRNYVCIMVFSCKDGYLALLMVVKPPVRLDETSYKLLNTFKNEDELLMVNKTPLPHKN